MAASTLRFGALGFVSGVPMTAAGLLLAGGGTAATTAAWSTPNILGNVSIALGLILFFWGTTIHGRHLWQPWWKGPAFPFRIEGWTTPADLEPGTDVHGITWERGFSHVHLRIANDVKVSVEDLSVVIRPEYPIFQSRAFSDFANPRIAQAVAGPTLSISTAAEDGSEKTFAVPPTALFFLGAPHRLQCDRLPAGAFIDVHLATAVPNPPPSFPIQSEKRVDPTYSDLEISWTLGGQGFGVNGRVKLSGGRR